jgi:23S rRNA pseudouridine2605 synthase
MSKRPAGTSPPLARALSKLGLAPRSQAHALIRAGRVTVNGRVVTNAAVRVPIARARIAVDGQSAASRAAPRLIAFHKPRGVVTTRRDPEGRQTVFDVLGAAGDGLIAIGRLDLASTGLLLFTNDTALADRLTDPRSGVAREYVVTVRGFVTDDTAAALQEHVEKLQVRKRSHRETHLLVTLTRGRNREIRRVFDAVGHEVTRLHRISFGDHGLGELEPGQWREIREVSRDRSRRRPADS